MQNLLAIYRAERFSPNAAERDRAIMDEVCNRLESLYIINKVKEENILLKADNPAECSKPDVIISMARDKQTLERLHEKETEGATVINRPAALLKASRSFIDDVMRTNGLPAAPQESNCGWWIKRGDESAQEKSDVVFAENDKERDERISDFHRRGISNLVVTAHVVGDLVKFYGVQGTTFFRTFYPTDGNYSKFGDEKHNGTALHTPFCIDKLNEDCNKLATLTGIDIYGGDAIVRPDGSYAIIDFNDWPSFSACREEAAEAIAQKTINTVNKKDNE